MPDSSSASRRAQQAGRPTGKSGNSRARGDETRNRSGRPGITDDQRRRYLVARLVEGKDLEQAAREIGKSKAWASGYEKDQALKDAADVGLAAGPIPREMLSPEAARALDDFGYFRHRYFGRRSVPWAEDVAYRLKEKLESPFREFGIVNIAPGVGKSTLFTHDFTAWITARDRTMTGIIGSSTLRLAFPYIMRLRRSLEATVPAKAKAHELEHGFAFDAEACMATDFGPFRPLNPDVWRQDAFTVWQDAGVNLGEKESTWMAFAQGEQLGWRVRFIIWDDLVTRKVTLSAPETEKQRLFWDDECECQPAGSKVRMADGTLRAIETIQTGETVLGESGPTRVIGRRPIGVAPVWELTTRYGRRLRVTGNHPLWTPVGWVRADRAVGHQVLIPAVHGTERRDDAWLIGAMLGDGCMTKAATTERSTFTGNDEVLERAKAEAAKLGWRWQERKRRGCWDLHWSNGSREWARELGIAGHGSLTKFVPDVIYRGDEETVLRFLAGLVDTDGSIVVRDNAPCALQIRVISKELVVGAQELIARFGVQASVTVTPNKKGYADTWNLRVPYSTGWPLVHKLVPHVSHAEKRARLEWWAERVGPTFGDHYDRVVSAELVGEEVVHGLETGDHTYVTEGVLTHNTRLEPGGLLLLQGQRLAPNDLYRYNLDKKADVDLWEFDSPDVTEAPKYFHIVYRAHYDGVCQVKEGPEMREKWERFHSPKAVPAGGFVDGVPTNGGCLLDPYRLPHRELSAHKRNNPMAYAVVYNQEDTAGEDVLVPAIMLEGGKDDQTGEVFPGCLDRTFSIGQPPVGLRSPRSVITVDPSGTKWWVVQWWLVDAAGYRWLGNMRRRKMRAPDLLEWDVSRGQFKGVLEEWCNQARELHYPVSTIIVEQNAAQRYLLQYEFVRRWRAHQGVSIIGHETGMNKTDPDKGVWSIQKQFRAGMVRLPYADPSSRSTLEPFLTELKGYPYADTTDCVMAYWFLEFRLPSVRRVEGSGKVMLNQHLPSWMRDAG